MAVRHQLIFREPAAVWAVLEDQSRYSHWVVGTSGTRPCEGQWPEVGSSLTYTVRLGPREFEGTTVVRRLERPRILELEAHSWPLGTARIAIEIRPWGEHTLVIVDEHPLRGSGARAHNVAADALLQIRHRSMLQRLAKTVEDSAPQHRARSDA
jgi:hypothetical protein